MLASSVSGFSHRLAGMVAEPEDSEGERLRKSLLLWGILALTPVVIPWAVIYLYIGEPLAAAAPIIYMIVSWSCFFIFRRTRHYDVLLRSQQISILLLPFSVMLILGGFAPSSVVILWSLVTPLGTLVIVGAESARRWLIVYLALVVSGGLLDPILPNSENISQAMVVAFFALNIIVVSIVVFIPLSYYVRERKKAYRLLSEEQDKSERLLLNVLPKEVASILKNEEQTIAEHFESASVLFADVVGFTPLSAEMSPAEMVGLLNEIFSYFDSLVDKYGLEKIRTVGDNYMVASGVPRPREDHAQALADMALEMVDYIIQQPSQDARSLNFRIGFNSGPMVGGVIGRRKFHYDVWGDTVNIASRMESHGVPGKIQITAASYELLKGEFECQARGTISVKGKGEMETWFLTGRK